MKLKNILLLTVCLNLTNIVFAETDYAFENGSAVVVCQREEGIPEEDFNKVFPDWTLLAQTKYDEGIVEMVQYTHELNKGIVVSINASDKIEENILHANQYIADVIAIAKEAGIELRSQCKVIAMGPIWLKHK